VQYDLYEVERNLLNRTIAETTALTGYAGGKYKSHDGKLCYHGLPASAYDKLGHTEVVAVDLDTVDLQRAKTQFAALCSKYFKDGFVRTPEGMQRHDPQDSGAEYRNAIGLPGGTEGPFYPIVQQLNSENNNMPLLRGVGGDDQDEYVVWIYDSARFPFFRAEPYHQFHKNSVLKRPIPRSYSHEAREEAQSAGRINSTGCPGETAGQFAMLLVVVFLVVTALSGCVLAQGVWQRKQSGSWHEESSSKKPSSRTAVTPGAFP
jgi:hypothetical protein